MLGILATRNRHFHFETLVGLSQSLFSKFRRDLLHELGVSSSSNRPATLRRSAPNPVTTHSRIRFKWFWPQGRDIAGSCSLQVLTFDSHNSVTQSSRVDQSPLAYRLGLSSCFFWNSYSPRLERAR